MFCKGNITHTGKVWTFCSKESKLLSTSLAVYECTSDPMQVPLALPLAPLAHPLAHWLTPLPVDSTSRPELSSLSVSAVQSDTRSVAGQRNTSCLQRHP